MVAEKRPKYQKMYFNPIISVYVLMAIWLFSLLAYLAIMYIIVVIVGWPIKILISNFKKLVTL